MKNQHSCSECKHFEEFRSYDGNCLHPLLNGKLPMVVMINSYIDYPYDKNNCKCFEQKEKE